MLRKLIKHELRATGRIMGIMLGLTLLSAVGGNIAVHNLMETQSVVLSVLGSLMLTTCVVMLAAVFIVTFVLMIRRFYQNLLRDEGYLMMTLPVSVHEHVLSKLFVSLIWAAATAITTLLAMGILVFDLEFVDMIVYDLEELIKQLYFSDIRLIDYTGHFALFALETILLMIAADSCFCMQFYAAMAAGHSFTHHKGLLSAAAYLIFSIAWVVLQSGVTYVFNIIMPQGISIGFQSISPIAAAHITLLSVIAAVMIPTVLWYGITTWFLQKRLNLN